MMKFPMRPTATALLVLLLALSQSLPAADPADCEGKLSGWWAQAEISWDLLTFFKDKGAGCWKNEENFISCWKAAESLAAGLGWRLQAGDGTPAPSEFTQIGPFILRPLEPPSGEFVPNHRLVERRAENVRQLSFLFSMLKVNASANRESFGQLLSHLHVRALASQDPKALIGRAYEAYRKVTDQGFYLMSPAAAEKFARQEEDPPHAGLWFIDVGGTKVIYTSKDGSAERVGVKDGDQLAEVDGIPAGHLTPIEIAQLAQARAEGAPARIKVNRGGQILEFELPMQRVPPMESRLVRGEHGLFGYIRLNYMPFKHKCLEIAETVRSFEEQGAQGLILDLRRNGGGSVQFAACVGAILTGERVMSVLMPRIYLQRRRIVGGPSFPLIRHFGYRSDLPATVLVDELTVSAGELLAGALQDYQRAWVIGRQTMGKGEYSMIFPDPSKTFFTHEIVAEYALPSHRSIQFDCVKPDFEIPGPGIDVRWQDGYLYPKRSVLFDGSAWTNPRAGLIETIADIAGIRWDPAQHADPELEYAQRVLRTLDELEISVRQKPIRKANWNNWLLRRRFNRAYDKMEEAEKAKAAAEQDNSR